MDEVPGSPTGPEAKRQRLEPEAICAENPQFPSSTKVGIVSHSINFDVDEYEVELYVVDLNSASDSVSSEYALAVPAVRFVLPIYDALFAVCVLNSAVYIFGGYNPYPLTPPPKKKYARKFVLSDQELQVLANGSGDSCLQVKEDELNKITVMNHAKAVPIAIATPDGKKILVFGGNVLEKDAFELYDTQENTWEDLPGLHQGCHYPSHTEMRLPFSCRCGMVKSYSFIDDSHFFLDAKIGRFVLNLSDKEWSAVGVPKIPGEYWGFGYFVTMKGCYAIISNGMTYYLPDGGFLSQTYTVVKGEFVYGPQFLLSDFPKDEEAEAAQAAEAAAIAATLTGEELDLKPFLVELYEVEEDWPKPVEEEQGGEKLVEEEEEVWHWVEYTNPQAIVRVEPPINVEVAQVAWTCLLRLQSPCPISCGGDVRILIDICCTELTPPVYVDADNTHPEERPPMNTTVFKPVGLRIPIVGCLYSLNLISL